MNHSSHHARNPQVPGCVLWVFVAFSWYIDISFRNQTSPVLVGQWVTCVRALFALSTPERDYRSYRPTPTAQQASSKRRGLVPRCSNFSGVGMATPCVLEVVVGRNQWLPRRMADLLQCLSREHSAAADTNSSARHLACLWARGSDMEAANGNGLDAVQAPPQTVPNDGVGEGLVHLYRRGRVWDVRPGPQACGSGLSWGRARGDQSQVGRPEHETSGQNSPYGWLPDECPPPHRPVRGREVNCRLATDRIMSGHSQLRRRTGPESTARDNARSPVAGKPGTPGRTGGIFTVIVSMPTEI